LPYSPLARRAIFEELALAVGGTLLDPGHPGHRNPYVVETETVPDHNEERKARL